MGNEVRAEGYQSSSSGRQPASFETPGPSSEAKPHLRSPPQPRARKQGQQQATNLTHSQVLPCP